MWFPLKKIKNTNLVIKENMDCKDAILKEYKEIRHQYNNMLQSILCFIEEEDWESLKNYKDKLLEKTQVLNSRNLTQLVRIKNGTILNLIYKLLMYGKKAGTTIHLKIYNDIDDINSYEIQVYRTLEEYLYNAYEMSSHVGGPVNLKISGNNKGIRFVFENSYVIKGTNSLELNKTKRKVKSKNIFFNTFIETDKIIQEILITVIPLKGK